MLFFLMKKTHNCCEVKCTVVAFWINDQIWKLCGQTSVFLLDPKGRSQLIWYFEEYRYLKFYLLLDLSLLSKEGYIMDSARQLECTNCSTARRKGTGRRFHQAATHSLLCFMFATSPWRNRPRWFLEDPGLLLSLTRVLMILSRQ